MNISIWIDIFAHMAKHKYRIIGVMSGTSLDGIDLVYAKLLKKANWHYEILFSETVPYSYTWLNILRNLVSFNKEELRVVDKKYTVFLSEVVKNFIKKYNIAYIDAVCSHGHTALHKPLEGVTYQIGNLPILAKLIKKRVVCDFRVQDVKLGGQGAPLVPIGDKLLFSEYDFCLNLGGFANISMDIESERIAYDICPVNIVLNHYAKQLGLDYDDKGNIAASANLYTPLLIRLNQLDYYRQTPPKSLGLEWVQSHIFPLIDEFQLGTENILKTFCEHIAVQISKEIKIGKWATVLVTGGGSYNSYLISRIKFHTNNRVIIPNRHLIEFKEALIFGFLGVLKLRNEVNCLSSVTGATKDHSSGVIFHP